MSKNTNRDFTLARFLLDVLLDAVIVIVLVVLTRLFLFAPFQVHGQSMCDTFNKYNDECFSGDGEFVIISRLSNWNIFGWSPTSLQRGDVVVFRAPYQTEKEFYIKRVIGLPGDRIKIEKGVVSLLNDNGKYEELDESYLNSENLGNTMPYRTLSEIYIVPDGSLFLLGDNRIRSNDARRCFQQTGCNSETSPFLGIDEIEGEVKLVVFPITHFRWISVPDYSM